MRFISLLLLSSLLCPALATGGWKALPLKRGEVKKQLQARKIALVIGIKQTKARYWTPLRYAAHDAVRISRSLRKLARFDKIMLRIRKQDTTKQALWRDVKSLQKYVKSPLDTVFVYVSAHGTVAHNAARRSRERYIVTSDTTQHVDKTGMNVLRLVNQLKQLPSRKVVLMLATCYTGAPRSKSRTKPGHKGASMKGVKPLPTRALQILSASGYAQAAFESSDLRADVYTHFFLQCLQKLKKSGISAIDAHICAAQPTTRFVKAKLGEIQVPRVDSQPGANRDIFLIQRDQRRASLGYFWAGRKSQGIKYQLHKVAAQKGRTEAVHWAAPGEYLGLQPGRYSVIIRDPDGRPLRRYTITIQRQRITRLAPETLRDPFESLESTPHITQAVEGNILISAAYVAGVLFLATGATMLIYGLWQDKPLFYVSSGLVLGSAPIILIGAIAADLSHRRYIHRLRQLQYGPPLGSTQKPTLPLAKTKPGPPLLPTPLPRGSILHH